MIVAKSTTVVINILANGSAASQQFRNVGAAASAMGKQIAAANVTIGSQLKDLSSKIRNVGEDMRHAGKKMTTHMTLPILAGFKASIDASKNYAESVNKILVLFGPESTAQLRAWADTAAQSMGVSARGALDAAANFGLFGKAAGLTGTKLVSFSKDATQLGVDLASFANTSVADAQAAISSALANNIRPMRRYAVLLDQHVLKARAASMGLIEMKVDSLKLSQAQERLDKATRKVQESIAKHGQASVQTKDATRDQEQASMALAKVMEGKYPAALDPATRILAAYYEILAQTTTQQGDFARTSDSVANQEKITAAEAENAAKSLGDVLAPAYKKLVAAVQDVMNWIRGLTEEQKRWILIAAAVVAAIGPVVYVLGAITSAIGLLLNPIGLVVAAIALLAAGLVYAYVHFKGFRDVVDYTISWLKSNVPAAFERIKQVIVEVIDFIRMAWQRWGDDIKSVVSTVFNAIRPIISGVMNSIKATISTILATIRGDWSGVWNGLVGVVTASLRLVLAGIVLTASLFWAAAKQVFTAFWNGLKDAWTQIESWFKGVPTAIKSAIGDAKTMLEQVGKDIVQGLLNGIGSLAGKVKDTIGGLFGGLVKHAKNVVGSHSPSTVFEGIGHDIDAGLEKGINGWAVKAINASRKMAADAAQAAADAVSAVMGAMGAGQGFGSATRDAANAEEDLNIVRARQSTIAARIAAAEAKLAKARQDASEITAEEQVAIEDATEALEKAKKQYEAGEISIAALTVAEHKLKEAQDKATGATSDVTDAEKELQDLRDEERNMARDLRDAELKLVDAQLRLAQAQLSGLDASNKLNAGGSAMLALFLEIASQAGLTTSQIDMITKAINALPTSKQVTITTLYQSTGTPPPGGENPGSPGQGDTADTPGHTTPVSGKSVQVNYFTIAPGASSVHANAIVDALRAKGMVRPDGQVVVTR